MKNPLTSEEIAIIENLLADECPLTEIAKTIGRHPTCIQRRFGGRSQHKSDPIAGCRKLQRQLGIA